MNIRNSTFCGLLRGASVASLLCVALEEWETKREKGKERASRTMADASPAPPDTRNGMPSRVTGNHLDADAEFAKMQVCPLDGGAHLSSHIWTFSWTFWTLIRRFP